MSESIPLCRSPLSIAEQQRLLGLLDALNGFLGRPGDWGYGTVLGNLAIVALNARADVASASVEQRA